jgi:hypothetical protein
MQAGSQQGISPENQPKSSDESDRDGNAFEAGRNPLRALWAILHGTRHPAHRLRPFIYASMPLSKSVLAEWLTNYFYLIPPDEPTLSSAQAVRLYMQSHFAIPLAFPSLSLFSLT